MLGTYITKMTRINLASLEVEWTQAPPCSRRFVCVCAKLMRVILVASIANPLIVDRPVHYERVRNASNVYRENDTHQIALK